MMIVIGTVLSICGYRRINKFNNNRKPGTESEDPVAAVIYTVVVIFSCIIVIIQGIQGATDYPSLVKRLAKAETLQARVADIKAAHYGYKVDGALVAGSIENWKQSTVLSDYITKLATVEADYNGYLKVCKSYKETFILYFLGPGWAISDKIYNLDYISK